VRWEEIKARERRDGREGREGREEASRGDSPDADTLLGGIAPALPALLRAYHIGVRAASVNFDWPRAADVVDKIQEEVDELREVVEAGGGRIDQAQAEEEMGDLLFSIANLARKLGIEPETALRKANDKVTRRFTSMERAIAGSGRPMRDLSIEELEAQWQQAKARGDRR
jgi:ATP diphosphatase